MSYYHYFKLKEDSYFNKMTVDELKQRKNSSYKVFPFIARASLKAMMVKWYYEPDGDIQERYAKIYSYLLGIVSECTRNLEYDWALEIKEDEDEELVRNRPMSEEDMQESLDTWNENIASIVSDLLILSYIKFEPDEHSDTPKNTPDYLKYEYQNQIDEKLSYLEDLSYDYEFAKFCLNNCTRQTEDEKYSDNN